MAGAHQRVPHRPRSPYRPHRTGWARFLMVFLPAVLAVAMIGAGAATGVVPVAFAVQGQQTLKIRAKSMSMQGAATFPEFFRTADGQRRSTVVVALKDLTVQGLCASTRVNTPVGGYVLRITTPRDTNPVSAGTVRFALDRIDGLGVLGQNLALNRAFAGDGTPTDAGDPGFLPIQAGGLLLNIDASARWATVNQLDISGVQLAVGRAQKECF